MRKLTLISLFLLASIQACSGQSLINQSNFYIPSGLTVTIHGSIINNGLLQNNGTLETTGDWLNTNVYQGSGLIQLSGTDQLLSNNDQGIGQLSIEGGGTKKILGKIEVAGSIDFDEGLVLVAAGDSLLLQANCKLAGGSTRSYVDGPLITEGSGYRFYPVGKNGNYHPVELLDIKGVEPFMEVEVQQNFPLITTDQRTSVRTDIYWTVKTIGGAFTGSPISLSYDLSMIDPARAVIVEGTDLAAEFAVLDNTLVRSSTQGTIVESRVDATGTYYGVGELLGPLPMAFYFSTTLAPNASRAENRVVRIFGGEISPDNFYFQVFNRWGLVIFETKSLDVMATTGWNGMQDGSMSPSGAYPFSLKYITTSGAARHQTGFITVLR